MSVLSFVLINAVLITTFCAVSFGVDSISSSQSISDGRTLVSKNGMFEFGFFRLGNSRNRYVGIWYKKIPVQTVVWVANRCNPINDSSGLLMLNGTGNLVLLNQNKSVVWSTSSSKQARKPIVQLLDSGNLVLREEENQSSEDYLWQSFDYPSDTLLPGMKIGWDLRKGLNWRLSAWKSWDDPCSSDFTFGVESREGYIRRGGVEYYRTGPWNGFGLGGSVDLKPDNIIYDYKIVYNANETYYMYSLKNSSVISRMVLNRTTSTRQRFIWIERSKSWRLFASAPRDICDIYGQCGANANCVISENPPCQCLKGFKPKSQENWIFRDWSEGCVRNNWINCKDRDEDDFVKMVGLKLPDSRKIWVNESMNLKECRAKCLSNCSCTAYSNRDERDGSGCRIWFGDLMDIRQIPQTGQDLYVRIRASEIEKVEAASRVRGVIVLAVLGAILVALLVGSYFLWRKWKGGNEKESQKEDDLELPLFNLSTIIAGTDNFSENNKLGEGGFGSVYRGRLEDGQEVAVKRLSTSSGQGMDEFKNEVILIEKLQHRNLVKLLGCCIQGEEKILVYELMPNKGLDSFIFDNVQAKLLDWPKRFQIIFGIARGLLYLHQDSRLRIIHRDLKASNVLLDNEMNPKISDFGMARTFGGDQSEGNTSRVVGTYGYMAPEYAINGLFSTKSDVYSFGVMVLEIVSGKRSRFFHDENHGLTLIGHAWKLMKAGRTFDLIDVCLRESYNADEVLRCVHVGLLCVQQRPTDRPSMSSVVLMLSSERELPEPEEPACYFMATDSQQDDRFSCTTNNVTISELVPR